MLQRELEHNPSVKTDAAAAFLASLEDPKLTSLGEAVKKPPIEILPPGMTSLSAPPITIKKKPAALPAPTTPNPNATGTPIGAQNASTNPIGTPIGAPTTAPTAAAAAPAAPSDDKEKDKPLMLEGPKDETTASTDEQAQDAAKTDEVVAKSEPASEEVDAPKDGHVENESSAGGSGEKSEVPAPSEEKEAAQETKSTEAVTPV